MNMNMVTQTPAYYRDLLDRIQEESLTTNTTSNKVFKNSAVQEFVKYAMHELGCDKQPKIILSKNQNKVREFKSFGHLNFENGNIWVYVGNRNLADILRTVCHEMVHFKQMLDGRLTSSHDGDDGSDIENEANSVAAVIMRQYGRANPHIFE